MLRADDAGVGMIDAARLSGTRTREDSRSTGLITATRDAHIIVIFIKHRSYIFAGPGPIMPGKTFDEILVVFDDDHSHPLLLGGEGRGEAMIVSPRNPSIDTPAFKSRSEVLRFFLELLKKKREERKRNLEYRVERHQAK